MTGMLNQCLTVHKEQFYIRFPHCTVYNKRKLHKILGKH